MGFSIKTEKILSPSNIKRIISLGISLKDSISTLEDKCIEDYDSTKTYVKNSLVIYNGYIYKTKTVTTGDFDENKFEKIGDNLDLLTLDDIKALINLSDEEIASLQSLISTEIRLDKCFSSSDTYNRLLTVENECKKFTLEQLAKKAGVVYKVVADTTGVDSTEFLYLISNGSNGYNIYAYIDGSAVKISDTNINLDDYAKLSDLNNYYDKATSDGKYATITTVDKKAEKTDLDNHINDTVAHMTQDEKDSYALKSSITDIIDSKSTSTDIASAKGVYNNIINKVDNTIVLNTADEVNSFNRGYQSFMIHAPVADAIGLPNLPSSTWFCINLSHSKGFKYPSQIAFEYAGLERIMYRTSINGVWCKWKKLCSTSAKDVPVTNIAPSDTTTFINFKGNSNCNYCVKNGICYVSLWGVKIASTGGTIKPGVILPKSANNRAGALMTGTGDATEHAFAFIIDTGELCFDVKDANIPLYCSFSYPVSES